MLNLERSYRIMLQAGGEAPSGGAELQAQKVETGKPLEYYQKLVEDLKEGGKESLSKETLAPLLKAIDASDFGEKSDALKRTLFNEIRQAIVDVMEPVKSEILNLADTLEKDNVDIPKGADVNEISEFINDEGIQRLFQNMTDVLGNIDGLDDVSTQMLMWKNLSNVFQKIESGEAEKMTQVETSIKDLNTQLSKIGETTENTIGAKNKALVAFSETISKIYGPEVGKEFKESNDTAMRYVENKMILKNEEGIDFDQLNVAEALMDFPEKITDQNKTELITKLQELSENTEFDQNKAIEKIINETNEMDPEVAASLGETLNQTGELISGFIITQGNKGPIGEWIAKLFREGGPLAILGALFGQDFKEAISEGNLKKQKALFELVKISSTETTEGYKIAGTDFSNIKSSDLKGFFKSMDSHGIDYSKDNFWENILTGKSEDGYEDEATIALHTELNKGNGEYFTFDSNDYADSNKLFLERLNAIPKKAGEEGESGESSEDESDEGVVQDSSGQAVGDSSGEPVKTGGAQ